MQFPRIFGWTMLSVLGISALGVLGYALTTSGTARATVQAADFPLRAGFSPEGLGEEALLDNEFVNEVLNGTTFSPPARRAYYAAFDNVNGCVITGWGGQINSVTPNAQGYAVTVFVTPDLITTVAAAVIPVSARYEELYQVFPDGTFQFIGSLDPMGNAGQWMGLIGL